MQAQRVASAPAAWLGKWELGKSAPGARVPRLHWCQAPGSQIKSSPKNKNTLKPRWPFQGGVPKRFKARHADIHCSFNVLLESTKAFRLWLNTGSSSRTLSAFRASGRKHGGGLAQKAGSTRCIYPCGRQKKKEPHNYVKNCDLCECHDI